MSNRNFEEHADDHDGIPGETGVVWSVFDALQFAGVPTQAPAVAAAKPEEVGTPERQ